MEELSDIQKIIFSSIRKEPAGVKIAFDAAMNDKLTELLAKTKIETARSLFLAPDANATETPEEVK